ncbi:MAG: EamA family transporter [Clostridia bacterium]|nr:EamA family transporter [Clostridia bacterium]
MVFVLAIIGMICWGVAPVFVKTGLRDVNPLVGLSIRTFFTAAFLLSWMIINGSISQLKIVSTNSILLLCIEALFATLIGDLAYFAAVKRGSASLVTIIMSSSPLITIICSVAFLGEKLTIGRIIGSLFIITGIVLVI